MLTPAPAPPLLQAMAATVMLVSLGLGQAAERLLGWPPSLLPPALAFSTVFAALAMLAKVG